MITIADEVWSRLVACHGPRNAVTLARVDTVGILITVIASYRDTSPDSGDGPVGVMKAAEDGHPVDLGGG